MWLKDSSIGRKLIMSISGLFLVLFLTFHLAMNIVAIFSPSGYNAICHFLGANWYALVGTLVLVAGFLLHIAYAFYLTLQNRKARGNDRYAVTARPKGVAWASQNMLVLGIVVVLGLALHACQFWAKMQFVELQSSADLVSKALATNGSYWMVVYFTNPVYLILYLVWFGALWFHLTHGFWSAIQTIGWNNLVWLKRWKTISNVYATIICGGFAAVALYIALFAKHCSEYAEIFKLVE